MFSKSFGLSVIVVLFNMRRESPRTLQSLTRGYQGLEPESRYEVVAIDNGSTQPLSAEVVRSFGPEFSYHYVESSHPSPCATINNFVAKARFDNILVLIDGARMLSPGIARLTFKALEAFKHPFIYTLGMHLGDKPQNYLVSEGYNAATEDQLLETVDWRTNGYSLFSISSPALSSKRGFFSKLTESNCFALRKDDFMKVGAYNTQFTSPGGGLCNLDMFNRIHDSGLMEPIMLLGEASFHQFHGGVATNAPIAQHPWESMQSEYAEIVGEPYQNKFRRPLYFGHFRSECAELYNALDDANRTDSSG